ncbi:MAG TPA: DUF2510 domain-containing protein [Nocardioides sp.]|nr:DUF2510 domain-containing protein [Nocardioides sp.]
MTSAGWYPDPAGQPHTYRYWDGTSWSEATTTNPSTPVPGATPAPPTPPPPVSPPPASPPPAAPPTAHAPGYGQIAPPPPGYGQQGYGQPSGYGQGGGYGQPTYGAPPAGGSGSAGGGSGRTIAIVLLAVVLIAALGVGGFFGVRALTGDDGNDTASGTSSDTGAAPTPPTEGSGSPSDGTTPTPSPEQCRGGDPDPGKLDKNSPTLTGGGLTIPSLVDAGYTVSRQVSAPFTFADAYQVSYLVVQEDGGWISNYGVGGLRKANGFDSTEDAARKILACMTGSSLYDGFSSATDRESGPVTVDGHDAYSIVTEVRVDNPAVTVEGDLVQVVVVDTGDPDSYGLYISAVLLGDSAAEQQQADMFDQISVG